MAGVDSDNPQHPLINTYCTVTGLTSDGGVQLNGYDCFVVKAAEDRLAVAMLCEIQDLGCKYKSLKPENLQPRDGVVVRPSLIEGGGNGVFATKNFAKGDIILKEFPFISMELPIDDTDVSKNFSLPAREALATLTRGRYTGGTWAPIFANNAISSDARRDSDTRCKISTLYPIMCRINHRCTGTLDASARPNVSWSPNEERILTATCDIKADSELFVDYLTYCCSPQVRRDALSAYKIPPCGKDKCFSCTDHDHPWEEYYKGIGLFEAWLQQSTVNPQESLARWLSSFIENAEKYLETIEQTAIKLIGLMDNFQKAPNASTKLCYRGLETAVTFATGALKYQIAYQPNATRVKFILKALCVVEHAPLVADKDLPDVIRLLVVMLEKARCLSYSIILGLFCCGNEDHPVAINAKKKFKGNLEYATKLAVAVTKINTM